MGTPNRILMAIAAALGNRPMQQIPLPGQFPNIPNDFPYGGMASPGIVQNPPNWQDLTIAENYGNPSAPSLGTMSGGGASPALGTAPVSPAPAGPRLPNIPNPQMPEATTAPMPRQQPGALKQILGNPQIMQALAQAAMLGFGGPNKGYMVGGMQQQQELERQRQIEQQRLAQQQWYQQQQVGMEGTRIKGEQEERTLRREELKSQRDLQNVSGALDDAMANLGSVDTTDPAALQAYFNSIAEARQLTPEQTTRFLKVANQRAALKPRKIPSDVQRKVDAFKEVFNREPTEEEKQQLFGLAPKAGTESFSHMEIIDPKAPGGHRTALVGNRGEILDPDTKAVIKGAQQYYQPSAGMLSRDEMEPVLDRVAADLAAGNLSRIKDIASLRGDQRLRLYDKVKKLNPKFSTAEVDRQVKMEDWVTNGKGADQLQSYGTFLEHAGAMADAAKGVKLTDARILNKPWNKIREEATSNPELARLVVAVEPVRKEFESFLLNNRALYEDDRREAINMISENQPLKVMIASLNQMGHTAQARYTEINGRYKRVRKQDIPDPFTPEAIEGARKIGVDLTGQQPEAGGANVVQWEKGPDGKPRPKQ